MSERLSLKLVIQWFVLYKLKNIPLTMQELYNALENESSPPTKPGMTRRSYSIDKVYLHVKELCDKGEVVEVKGEGVASYSITKSGHQEEIERRNDLKSRISVTLHALEVMELDLMISSKKLQVQMVPQVDREFLRSLISIKDVVRYFIIDELQQESPLSMKELYKRMDNRYGWVCSNTYFHYVGRNELCEGVNEYNKPIEVETLLIDKWERIHTRQQSRVYSISDLDRALQWKERFVEDAIYSVKAAKVFVKGVLDLLKT
ncbi:hypothetical protein BKP35_16335 [Anaerobacillus arseniciselenatis]|uniref:Uncharacterized protein n=1 Tax=Anaerobacillus arseniciselenatis TaxID=85682 RepID=A0A1S2LAA5_9BACI|nr:hypothetical protein [Anaerobacillus arseniciselenatis]OIJ09422.1 hypothetical protein BKP35_16335 [Anaerobacillus arseniciselenatis]